MCKAFYLFTCLHIYLVYLFFIFWGGVLALYSRFTLMVLLGLHAVLGIIEIDPIGYKCLSPVLFLHSHPQSILNYPLTSIEEHIGHKEINSW